MNGLILALITILLPILSPISAATSPINNDCIRTGCSGQICAEKETPSTCEWKEIYSCYASAECTRQANGSCGFTQTSTLLACLSQKQIPTPTPAEPLLCTGTSCSVLDTQPGLPKQIQCSVTPLATSILAERTIEYEGYCTRKKHVSMPNEQTSKTQVSEYIPLVPVLPSSPRFQPITALPGVFSCYVRYCVTDMQQNKTCIPWGVSPPTTSPQPTISSKPSEYSCPTTEWIDCMPGPDMPEREQCSPAYLNWATNNCDGFKGAAY